MAAKPGHPAETLAAQALAGGVAYELEKAEALQADYPNVSDYRLTQAIEALTKAARLLKELGDGTTTELDATRAAIAKNPDHPLWNGYLGQVKTSGSDRWVTFTANTDATEAYKGFVQNMKTHGLGFREIKERMPEVLNGENLVAPDGTEFRVIAN